MPLNNPSIISSSTSTTVTRATIAVPSDITVAQILVASNAARKGLTLWNNSTGNVFIELGAAPTALAYSVRLSPGGYYELPYHYTGEIQGLWDAAGGTGVLVREFV